MSYKLGKDAVIYYGAAGSTATTPLEEVSEVTYDEEDKEVDVRTRASGAFESTEQGATKITVTFTLKVKVGDTARATLLSARRSKTPVAFQVLDAPAGSGGEGVDGDFVLTKMSRKEPLDDAVSYDCTAMLNTNLRLPTYI